jgi:hypothetical protein
MANGSGKFEAGLVAEGARNAGREEGYWQFVAYEKAINQHLTIVSVDGRVLVGNPGMKAVLSYAEPQGINPDILVLFLDIIQTPGPWPQRLTWAPCAYSHIFRGKGLYKEAQITDGEISVTVPFVH